MGRPRRFFVTACTAAALTGGCYDESIYDDLVDLDDAYGDSSTSGSSSTSGPTSVTVSGSASTTDGSGSATTSGTESASGSGGEGEVEPQIALAVAPSVLTVAGHLAITVEHSADVERIELFQGTDAEPVLVWHAGEAPPELLVTRGTFGEQRHFRARGYDAEDNYGVSGEVFVELQLPKPGTLLLEESFAVGSVGEGRAVVAGSIVGEPQLLVAHDDDQSAIVGRYTAQGTPQMKAAPSEAPISVPTGIALDGDEKIIAVGVDLIVDQERAWVARVDPHTAAVELLFQGKLGEAATGCAIDPVSKRIYVSGYGPGKYGDAAHDAMLWALSEDGAPLWTKKWERPISDKDKGEPFDRASAVAVLDDGDPVIVGESRFQPKDDKAPLEVWAFAHRYSPSGALAENKSWTSAGVPFGASAHAVTPDRDNGLLVAGWSRVIEGAPRQATVFVFGPLLEEAEIYTSEPSGDWTAKGAARLPTGDFVYASDFDGLGRHDAEVRGIAGLFGEPAWSYVFAAEDVARVGALTLTRDAHIIVVWTRRAKGLNTMFLAALHP